MEHNDGVTIKSKTEERTFYTTINKDNSGHVCEIFVRLDDPDGLELTTVITRLASMALREGVDPLVVARELQQIHSPVTRHIIPGTKEMCVSITARIGKILEEHL